MAVIFHPLILAKLGICIIRGLVAFSIFKIPKTKKNVEEQIDGLVQERCNSIANELELCLSLH